MTQIAYKRYTGFVVDAQKDAANAALEAVSGDFDEFFRFPCNQETDDENTIRAWTCRQVLLGPSLRQKGNQALATAGIVSPNLEYTEVEARGNRFPDATDLFLAEHQLRQVGSFVHVTGLFRASVASVAQTVSASPSLIDQWTSTDDMRNCAVSGDGNRLEVDFAGTYFLEASLRFVETGDDFVFRLVKNVTQLAGSFSSADSPAQGSKTASGVIPTDKFGISVQVASGTATFQMTGGWFGLKRIA